MPQHVSDLFAQHLETPIGSCTLVTDASGAVVQFGFGTELELGADARVTWDPGPGAEARRQLEEYFAGKRRVFELEVAPRGTPFQERVWRQLRAIPFGATKSYGQIAEAVGSPGGMRAVGQANGNNPIAVIVPCHRVVAADGGLGGYSGGLDKKRWLLEREGVALGV